MDELCNCVFRAVARRNIEYDLDTRITPLTQYLIKKNRHLKHYSFDKLHIEVKNILVSRPFLFYKKNDRWFTLIDHIPIFDYTDFVEKNLPLPSSITETEIDFIFHRASKNQIHFFDASDITILNRLKEISTSTANLISNTHLITEGYEDSVFISLCQALENDSRFKLIYRDDIPTIYSFSNWQKSSNKNFHQSQQETRNQFQKEPKIYPIQDKENSIEVSRNVVHQGENYKFIEIRYKHQINGKCWVELARIVKNKPRIFVNSTNICSHRDESQSVLELEEPMPTDHTEWGDHRYVKRWFNCKICNGAWYDENRKEC